MNFIKRLQADLEAKTTELDAKLALIAEFERHLQGPKYQGADTDGTRKDWISTGDVTEWLRSIRSVGT